MTRQGKVMMHYIFFFFPVPRPGQVGFGGESPIDYPITSFYLATGVVTLVSYIASELYILMPFTVCLLEAVHSE